MSVTINDISRAAKVSKAVVSKVINNKPDVAPETRKSVLKVIDELGYIPNARARELSLGTNSDITVVLPSDNTAYIRLLFSIYRILSAHSYNVTFHITDHDKEKESGILCSLRGKYLRGLICFADPDGDGGACSLIEKIKVPTVVLGDGAGFDGFKRVFCHERDMAEALASAMKERGFRRIACFNMPEEKEYQKKRNAYMRLALAEVGFLEKNVTFFDALDVSAAEGYRMMGQLSRPSDSLGVCLLSNVFAGGALCWLKEKEVLDAPSPSLFVLGDLSSFDELGLQYTYVSLPIEELALKTAQALVRKIEENSQENLPERVKPSIRRSNTYVGNG